MSRRNAGDEELRAIERRIASGELDLAGDYVVAALAAGDPGRAVDALWVVWSERGGRTPAGMRDALVRALVGTGDLAEAARVYDVSKGSHRPETRDAFARALYARFVHELAADRVTDQTARAFDRVTSDDVSHWMHLVASAEHEEEYENAAFSPVIRKFEDAGFEPLHGVSGPGSFPSEGARSKWLRVGGFSFRSQLQRISRTFADYALYAGADVDVEPGWILRRSVVHERAGGRRPARGRGRRREDSLMGGFAADEILQLGFWFRPGFAAPDRRAPKANPDDEDRRGLERRVAAGDKEARKELARLMAESGEVFTEESGFKEFLLARDMGLRCEVDKALFWYFLEVLPPRFIGRHVKLIDGSVVRASFGFAEGMDPVTAFWEEGERYFAQLAAPREPPP